MYWKEIVDKIKAGKSVENCEVDFNNENIHFKDVALLNRNGISVPEDLIYYDDNDIDFSDDPEWTDDEIKKQLKKDSLRLVNITYKDNNWSLQKLELNNINLIVGKNATGKSRSIRVIESFAKMITQQTKITCGSWSFLFEKDNSKIRYQVDCSTNGNIEQEHLFIDEKIVLERTAEYTNLFSVSKNSFEKIFPPKNKLTLHVRRDRVEYPFFEDLIDWAENSFSFKFGNIYGKELIKNTNDLLKNIDDIPTLFKNLDANSLNKIILDLQQIGYNINKIYVKERQEEPVIYVKENGLQNDIPHFQLSQGMIRALSLLVFIEYVISNKKAATLIIDDLCEGLDYERATNLGKIIFEKFKNSQIQFIATSNDSFLMEVVAIKYWNILTRKNHIVSSLNYVDNTELFNEFKFTGLGNFDFFSSDYIINNR